MTKLNIFQFFFSGISHTQSAVYITIIMAQIKEGNPGTNLLREKTFIIDPLNRRNGQCENFVDKKKNDTPMKSTYKSKTEKTKENSKTPNFRSFFPIKKNAILPSRVNKQNDQTKKETKHKVSVILFKYIHYEVIISDS